MADTARPIRVTRRNVLSMQSKENQVLGQKNVISKKPTLVRATLGEISNKSSVVTNNVEKGGALKRSLAVSNSNSTFSKSDASKENLPVQKPKGLAVKASNVGKSVIAKPIVTGKPTTGVLPRVPIKPGLAVQNVNKATPVIASTVKTQSKPSASVPKPESKKEEKVTNKVESKEADVNSKNTVEPIVFTTEQLNFLKALDEADKEDPQYVVDYVKEIYTYMNTLEAAHSIPKDYIKQCKFMTYNMRAILIDWLVLIHCQFKLNPETLYLAVAIFDRYMPHAADTPKQNLQLVGVVSLLIASKYEEIMCPTVGDCTYITDDAYTKKQVMDMEMKILSALKFNIGRPIPLHFLRRYTYISEAGCVCHNIAKYFMELMLIRHEMCHVCPSLQSAAAMCLAKWVDVISQNELTPIKLKKVWNFKLQYASGYSFQEIEESLKTLVVVVVKGHRSNLTAVRKKYASKSYMEVSRLVEGVLPRIQALHS